MTDTPGNKPRPDLRIVSSLDEAEVLAEGGPAPPDGPSGSEAPGGEPAASGASHGGAGGADDGAETGFTRGRSGDDHAARWAKPGRIIKAAWPGQGKDFNDLRMECAA